MASAMVTIIFSPAHVTLPGTSPEPSWNGKCRPARPIFSAAAINSSAATMCAAAYRHTCWPMPCSVWDFAAWPRLHWAPAMRLRVFVAPPFGTSRWRVRSCAIEFRNPSRLRFPHRKIAKVQYNRSVTRSLSVIVATTILSATVFAQSDKNPQIKINYLNVCTPSAEEQKELSGALARIPVHPKFSEDFEVSRGRSTMTEPPIKLAGAETEEAPAAGSVSRWVRVRKEFSADSPFVSVQYS